jgi:mono/diheme cytochrome c family protein
MRSVFSMAAALAALLLVGAAVAFSGVYNVAASEAHSPLVEKLLQGAMRRSVARHAPAIAAPDLAEEARVTEGLSHYAGMCELCHGAPGREPGDVAEGLYPRPPQFTEKELDWTDEEVFWITKHGLKLTGMPGFGASHGDDEIWSIVAAVRKLPELDPAAYRAATESVSARDGAHDHSGHHH